jgi:F420-dependent oxidoreductase-like protein
MRLGLSLGYFGTIPTDRMLSLVQQAESLGYDSAWCPEAYGGDAVVPLAWLAGQTTRIKLGTSVLQMPARTPAAVGMTAATLDTISGGRLLLGLGVSGPQVVEGWHGVPYGKPLARTREYVSIVREILRREGPVEHHGEVYEMPYAGPGATGLGKPLKLILHPIRNEIPIYLAALGPRNVRLTAQIADGWLPTFFSPSRFGDVFGEALAGADLSALDIAPSASVVLGDDVQACRDSLRPSLALSIGGMGAKGANFYNAMASRYGYEAACDKIQELYLAGRKAEAAAAVPDELIDEVALCGPRERIADLLGAWRESPVTTLIVRSTQPKAIEVMAELLL